MLFVFHYVILKVFTNLKKGSFWEFFFVFLSAGCGLDFHKRCVLKLPNDCSRVFRRCGPSLSLFPPGRPRTPSLSSHTGGSLEEVTIRPDVHVSERCLKCSLKTFVFSLRSACRSCRARALRPGPTCRCLWGCRRGRRPDRESLTPSTFTLTPNPPSACTASGCSRVSSDRACSAPVREHLKTFSV